jgi:GT2 family glycosyltransferase
MSHLCDEKINVLLKEKQMSGKQFPWVSIIILNYNGWQDTITCLESVFNMDYENYFVVVLDNGSNDNSIENLKKWATGDLKYNIRFPDHPDFNKTKEIGKPVDFYEYERKELFINESRSDLCCEESFIPKLTESKSIKSKLIIIDNNKNLGYAGGNNVGIRYSLKYLNVEYVMVLNNDTAVPPNILRRLVDVFSIKENVGCCGPLEYSYLNPYDIQSAGGKIGLYTGYHKLMKSATKSIDAVDWICGSCILIKKEAILEVGCFDERYFLYVEEVDYAYRMKKKGYKVCFTLETSIWHKGGEGNSEPYYFYSVRNRLLFALKHLNIYQLTIFIPIHLVKWFFLRPVKDLISNKRINFSKKIYAIRDAFTAHKEKIKSYGAINEKNVS